MKRIIFLILVLLPIFLSGCRQTSGPETAVDWIEQVMTGADLLGKDVMEAQLCVPEKMRSLVEGLLAIRSKYLPEEQDMTRWETLSTPVEGVTLLQLRGKHPSKPSFRLLVIINRTADQQRIKIPNDYYQVLCYQERADLQGLGVVSGRYAYLDPETAMVLVADS